jgi:hypothetical protein
MIKEKRGGGLGLKTKHLLRMVMFWPLAYRRKNERGEKLFVSFPCNDQRRLERRKDSCSASQINKKAKTKNKTNKENIIRKDE